MEWRIFPLLSSASFAFVFYSFFSLPLFFFYFTFHGRGRTRRASSFGRKASVSFRSNDDAPGDWHLQTWSKPFTVLQLTRDPIAGMVIPIDLSDDSFFLFFLFFGNKSRRAIEWNFLICLIAGCPDHGRRGGPTLFAMRGFVFRILTAHVEVRNSRWKISF